MSSDTLIPPNPAVQSSTSLLQADEHESLVYFVR